MSCSSPFARGVRPSPDHHLAFLVKQVAWLWRRTLFGRVQRRRLRWHRAGSPSLSQVLPVVRWHGAPVLAQPELSNLP